MKIIAGIKSFGSQIINRVGSALGVLATVLVTVLMAPIILHALGQGLGPIFNETGNITRAVREADLGDPTLNSFMNSFGTVIGLVLAVSALALIVYVATVAVGGFQKGSD